MGPSARHDPSASLRLRANIYSGQATFGDCEHLSCGCKEDGSRIPDLRQSGMTIRGRQALRLRSRHVCYNASEIVFSAGELYGLVRRGDPGPDLRGGGWAMVTKRRGVAIGCLAVLVMLDLADPVEALLWPT